MYIQVVDANLVNNPIWSLFYLVSVLFLYYDGCYETVGFYIHKKSTILRLLIPGFFSNSGPYLSLQLLNLHASDDNHIQLSFVQKTFTVAGLIFYSSISAI